MGITPDIPAWRRVVTCFNAATIGSCPVNSAIYNDLGFMLIHADLFTPVHARPKRVTCRHIHVVRSRSLLDYTRRHSGAIAYLVGVDALHDSWLPITSAMIEIEL